MSEDERAKINQNEEQDDVDAHRAGGGSAAVNEEGSDEARREGDDDFEAHRKSVNRPGAGA